MGAWFGAFGPCRWSLIHGAFSDGVFEQFCEHVGAMTLDIEKGRVVLDIFHDISRPTPLQRQRVAGILATAPNLALVAGHAFVTNSLVGRGALTAINWVIKKEFPERVLGTPADGAAWLKEKNPALKADELIAHINEKSGGALKGLRW